MTDRPNRPRDANQLAKFFVDHSTMDAEELEAHRKRLANEMRQNAGRRGAEDSARGE